MPNPTLARRIGPDRYAIESFSGEGKTYIVDMSIPACDCAHFQYRLVGTKAECKHLKAVREQLAAFEELKARLEPATAPVWKSVKTWGPCTDEEVRQALR